MQSVKLRASLVFGPTEAGSVFVRSRLSVSSEVCVCVRVRACVRACVRVCVCVCVCV